MDQPTDGRTDEPSYRDAWTHVKMETIYFYHFLPSAESNSFYVCDQMYISYTRTDNSFTNE